MMMLKYNVMNSIIPFVPLRLCLLLMCLVRHTREDQHPGCVEKTPIT